MYYKAFNCDFSVKNILYKTACSNCLPDDEPMCFETCKCIRRQTLN